ncbi:hypothetical protein [Thalassotalea aquiviva]|uniref:hypothetical protein n=1 Tax=Thalassotalea aquiviva TaxID=3242415 RepID=UPI00352B7A3F
MTFIPTIAILSLTISSLICLPAYKYMFKAIFTSSDEFNKGATSLKIRPQTKHNIKEGFWYAAMASLMLPSIFNLMLAFILYLVISSIFS